MSFARAFSFAALALLLSACATSKHEIAGRYASPSELTKALEARWPLASIQTFCIPERRHKPWFQPPVALMQKNWDGRLYEGSKTGFDSIRWIAVEEGGHIQVYSLNATRGKDHWIVEIGPMPGKPDVAPDFHQLRFWGSKADVVYPDKLEVTEDLLPDGAKRSPSRK